MRPPEPAERAAQARLVVGLQPVREAIRVHGPRLSRVAIDDRAQPQLAALERFARDRGVPRVERLARSALDRLSQGVAHQGVAAWAPPLELGSLEALRSDPALLAVALDSIQDPQNFGAVIRSSVGVSAAAVLWGEHGSAPLSLATFRASAGAIEHARLVRVRSLHDALGELAENGACVVGLDAAARQPLRALDLTRPTVLVIGSEHEGLARNVRRACSEVAHLIAPNRIASLNASVAAAIALYEATIQRIKSGTYTSTAQVEHETDHER